MTPLLLRESGAFLGELDKVLDGFDHAGFHRSHAWDVRNTSMLPSFFEYLDEPWRLELVKGVVADFEGVVLPAAGELRMGLLQADFNDANIIIRRCAFPYLPSPSPASEGDGADGQGGGWVAAPRGRHRLRRCGA